MHATDTHMFRELTVALTAVAANAERLVELRDELGTAIEIDRDTVGIYRVDEIWKILVEIDEIANTSSDNSMTYQAIRHIDDLAWFVDEIRADAVKLAAEIRAAMVAPVPRSEA